MLVRGRETESKMPPRSCPERWEKVNWKEKTLLGEKTEVWEECVYPTITGDWTPWTPWTPCDEEPQAVYPRCPSGSTSFKQNENLLNFSIQLCLGRCDFVASKKNLLKSKPRFWNPGCLWAGTLGFGWVHPKVTRRKFLVNVNNSENKVNVYVTSKKVKRKNVRTNALSGSLWTPHIFFRVYRIDKNSQNEVYTTLIITRITLKGTKDRSPLASLDGNKACCSVEKTSYFYFLSQWAPNSEWLRNAIPSFLKGIIVL